MQALAHATPRGALKEKPKWLTIDWQLLITVAILIPTGSFTYSIYPAPVNFAALGIMIAIYYRSLHLHDPVTFFLQLFIGNFFIFGNKFGGNYNIAAFAAIVFYTAINGRIPFLKKSILNNAIKAALLIWAFFELLSITGGNHFPLSSELQNFLAFCMMLYLFYFVSRIPFTSDDYYKIVFSISVFFIYLFLVAFNQNYEFINSPFWFFPSTDKTIEYDQGITRCASTLGANFEAFAEFCVSLICILLPGILSGSSLKKNRFFYYFSMTMMLLILMAMIYSGTRSSILLLPIGIVGSFIFLGKRLNTKLVVLMLVVSAGLFVANLGLKFIDFSVFEERSENMDNVSLQTMLNGDAMNRGGLFPYAFQQMQNTGIIGRGYFTSPYEYRYVQFNKDDMIFDGIADYHNLYMSSYVLWGSVGFAAMMFLFFYPMYEGWKTYWAVRKQGGYMTDLLLGFNLLFVIMMINEFKIQFVRDVNYFTIVMMLLVLYISLAWQLKQTVQPKKRKHFRQINYEDSSTSHNV